ncbi:transketolase C-terminal domain-containing protein [Arthrobacter sp. NPDC056493]|uniref:transketolase C-terminal domain-containing protein n=1 Tax=Arthrobacter sp. NPDC056493 TaxID=3345839 RepID=UPI00366B997F
MSLVARSSTPWSRSGPADDLRSSDTDDVTLIGAGVTLHEALKAAEILGAEGIQDGSSTATP